MATDLKTWLSAENPLQSNIFVDLFGGAVVNASDTVDFSNATDVIFAVGANGNPLSLTLPPKNGEVGLNVSGTLKMGNGVDAVVGIGGNGANDLIALGGVDAGSGGDGIAITGTLDLGNGGDIAVGLEIPFLGLKGNGGNGANGLVRGSAAGDGGNGISVSGANAKLVSGNGDDVILGVGGNGGDGGNDTDFPGLNIGSGGAGGDGGSGLKIKAGAQILTGNGDDSITGIGGQGGNGGLRGISGSDGTDGVDGFGIFNNTSTGNINDGITQFGIDTGRGNDTVDASQGGFGGGGAINLGQGNDVASGFGSQYINAGSGFDVLNLGSGTFSSINAGNGWLEITSGGIGMFVTGFEQINGLV